MAKICRELWSQLAQRRLPGIFLPFGKNRILLSLWRLAALLTPETGAGRWPPECMNPGEPAELAGKNLRELDSRSHLEQYLDLYARDDLWRSAGLGFTGSGRVCLDAGGRARCVD